MERRRRTKEDLASLMRKSWYHLRVPWANPMGKVFLPLPFLASDEPDGPVPLLFYHILAIASCARQAFGDQGGMLTNKFSRAGGCDALQGDCKLSLSAPTKIYNTLHNF
ncbi:fucokinase [Trifolium repens]|nr:fucokinase [Trifolium repens]